MSENTNTQEIKRATKEFKTSGGHVVVTQAYITGLEVENIRNFYAGKVQIDSYSQKDEKVGVSGLTADAAMETKKLALRTVMVSVDGVSENVDNIALKLPNDDYQEILDAVNELIEGNKKK